MAFLFTNGKFQAINALGPVSGAKLYTYAAGLGLSPQATYTDQAGGSPNDNPVVCDTSGQASVWLGTSPYRFILKDAAGSVIWDVDNVGVTDSGSVTYLATGTGAVTRTLHAKLGDRVSVKDFGAVGDGVTNDTAAIQAAVTAAVAVDFPAGTYLISAKITMGAHSVIRGAGDHSTTIKGSHSGGIFEYPVGAYDCQIRDLFFAGASCTGIAVASGGGALQGYLIRATIANCSFGWELSYGINADCIFLRLRDCAFGYEGGPSAAAKAGAMVCLKSYSVSTNFTNLNNVERCVFTNSTAAIGASSAIAVDLSGGTDWIFNSCDWEQGGQALRTSNIHSLTLNDCWFESLTATQIIDVAATLQKTTINRCQFVSVTPTQIIQWNSSAGDGLVLTGNSFAFSSAAGYVLFDNPTSTFGLGLPAGLGKVIWIDNKVSAGNAAMVTQSSTRYDGNTTAKGWAIITTSAGAPVTVSASEPLTYARNGVGDININLTHYAAVSAAKLRANVTGNSAAKMALVSGISTGANIRVLLFNAAGAAVEDTFNITWGGSNT